MKRSMASEPIKSLSIKTNIVRRITKELQLYREEERLERQRVQNLKDNGGDPSDVKFAVRISSTLLQTTHCFTKVQQL